MKRKLALITLISSVCLFIFTTQAAFAQGGFLKVQGKDIVKPDGTKFFIKGTNLGNWLNPEGYMFGFTKTNSASMIDRMFKELVGEEYTASFWKKFKDNYITRKDIRFIKSTGANTIRLPLHYRLFTEEDYMGLTSEQDGFKRIDDVLGWCNEFGLYLILDMHCAPGGQGGGNVDDSFGYPWLFEDSECQDELEKIWVSIAERYKDNPLVLGYELLNEPIEHRPTTDSWNVLYYPKLEPLYKRLTAAIRAIDKNHIIILGGARGNTEFSMFTDWKFDSNLMYTCHCYFKNAPEKSMKYLVEFRDRTGVPMFVGETGHLTMEQQLAMSKYFISNNLGYTYWPYKKMKTGGSFVNFTPSAGWDSIVSFSEADRSSYPAIRSARPDQSIAKNAMQSFLEQCKFSNCKVDQNYINTTLMK